MLLSSEAGPLQTMLQVQKASVLRIYSICLQVGVIVTQSNGHWWVSSLFQKCPRRLAAERRLSILRIVSRSYSSVRRIRVCEWNARSVISVPASAVALCYNAQHPCWFASWPILDARQGWIVSRNFQERGAIYADEIKDRNVPERSPFGRLWCAAKIKSQHVKIVDCLAWLWLHLARTRTLAGSHYTTMDSCSTTLTPPTAPRRHDVRVHARTGLGSGRTVLRAKAQVLFNHVNF